MNNADKYLKTPYKGIDCEFFHVLPEVPNIIKKELYAWSAKHVLLPV